MMLLQTPFFINLDIMYRLCFFQTERFETEIQCPKSCVWKNLDDEILSRIIRMFMLIFRKVALQFMKF
jgi:hypothetical protein